MNKYYILIGILFFLAVSLSVLNATIFGTLQFYQTEKAVYSGNSNECYTIDDLGVKQPCTMGDRHISNVLFGIFVARIAPWLIVGALFSTGIFMYQKKIRFIEK